MQHSWPRMQHTSTVLLLVNADKITTVHGRSTAPSADNTCMHAWSLMCRSCNHTEADQAHVAVAKCKEPSNVPATDLPGTSMLS
jgi:hypothetical protein